MIAKLLQAKPIRTRKNLTTADEGVVYSLHIRGKFEYFCSRPHFDSKFRRVHSQLMQQNFAFIKLFRNKIGMPCREKGQY